MESEETHSIGDPEVPKKGQRNMSLDLEEREKFRFYRLRPEEKERLLKKLKEESLVGMRR